ncbi:hypothetical protein HDU83_003169 [Entophlyctis luteolus]|nr:hypothetical protein HDU83_003169 [Entophlyctis luteolus]KAJ3380320.1 hypothetical protein HDU84_006018 [Entophlyctis sp. JEL0112]
MSMYLKAAGMGALLGFGMETLLIKTGYYSIILRGEAKNMIRANASASVAATEPDAAAAAATTSASDA